MAALTVPEDEMWVNLSPYERDRIIEEGFGDTEMGRDLLAQDYILKQLTASLMYPEEDLGSTFWDKIYEQAYEKYWTTEIPTDIFHKVWPFISITSLQPTKSWVAASFLLGFYFLLSPNKLRPASPFCKAVVHLFLSGWYQL